MKTKIICEECSKYYYAYGEVVAVWNMYQHLEYILNTVGVCNKCARRNGNKEVVFE